MLASKPPPMRFTILNSSTEAARLNKLITSAWLGGVAAALTTQLDRDVSAYWGGSYSARVGAGVSDLLTGEVPFFIVDNLPNSPDAIAEHGVSGGSPIGWLALNMCHTLDDVSIGISHEFVETAGDPAVNRWVDNTDGYSYSLELCDAVESFSYKIGEISVSDFLLPSFFAPGAPGPFHYLAASGQGIDLPFAFSTGQGGYQVRRLIGEGQAQVFGDIPADKMAKKLHFTSRTWKRLRGK